jgi:membrane protein required for colicin V production
VGMIIDILAGLAIVMALIKGYSKGLIMALFNTLSLLIGLALAVKFSFLAAPFLHQHLGLTAGQAPIIAFILVFIGAILLIRLLGKTIQKTLETVKLGFVNRAGGMLLYLLVYLAITSVFIFYLEKIDILHPETTGESFTYPWLAPWGPGILDWIGNWIPLFKDMFEKINEWMDSLHETVTQAKQ